jgi:hypothetical protein
MQRLGNTVSLLFVVNPTALVSCDVIHVCGKMQSSKENCDKTLKAGQFLPGGRKCVIFHVKYKLTILEPELFFSRCMVYRGDSLLN